MRIKLLLFSLLTFITIISAPAKSLSPGKSNGHEADIYSVLPFERCTQISNLIFVLHNNIDHPIGYFAGLRDKPHHEFTWHKYGHRVFFHWGFNSNPRSCEILQQLVDERKWTKPTEQLFWDKVINEQARRNKKSMEEVSNTLGFDLGGAQRAYANAFASIITDIHLLGDYSTTNIATLQNINLIIKDLQKALFESLKGGDRAKKINKMMDDTQKIGDVRERANEVLKILQKELPIFFIQIQDGFFTKHFKKKNLPLKKV